MTQHTAHRSNVDSHDNQPVCSDPFFSLSLVHRFSRHRRQSTCSCTMSDSRPPLAGQSSQDAVSSLRELEPMPMPDSPLPTPPPAASDKKLPGLPENAGSSKHHSHTRSVSAAEKGTTGALGLSRGHSSIYYCEFRPVWTTCTCTIRTNKPSISHPALLFLRLYHFRFRPSSHRLPYPLGHPLRPGVRVLSPPRPRNLPDARLGTPARLRPHCGPRCCRCRPEAGTTSPKSTAVWGQPTRQEYMAQCQLDCCVGLRLFGDPCCSPCRQPVAAHLCPGRQLRYRPGLRCARLCTTSAAVVAVLRRLPRRSIGAHGLGLGTVAGRGSKGAVDGPGYHARDQAGAKAAAAHMAHGPRRRAADILCVGVWRSGHCGARWASAGLGGQGL